MSEIQWTDETWNPLVGCSKRSAGCKNCYAIGAAASVLRRLDGRAKSDTGRATVEAYREALDLTGSKPRWSGRAVPMPHQLGKPLRWKKPRRVFVNSMSDLFHPSVSDSYIAAVFGVMAATPHHTYQVLTKHPERASLWFRWAASLDTHGGAPVDTPTAMQAIAMDVHRVALGKYWNYDAAWPLSNVWLGTSVEDQATADERIPQLLACPAAVRWVSYEPALGAVDFTQALAVCDRHGEPSGPRCDPDGSPAVKWIVVGGESGHGARPFDVQWARDTIGQCREAGVAVFVKQLGADPIDSWNGCIISKRVNAHERHRQCGLVECVDYGCQHGLRFNDRKGGDMSEWPADLRVREWPRGAEGVCDE